jgi:hypothetical protein
VSYLIQIEIYNPSKVVTFKLSSARTASVRYSAVVKIDSVGLSI